MNAIRDDGRQWHQMSSHLTFSVKISQVNGKGEHFLPAEIDETGTH